MHNVCSGPDQNIRHDHFDRVNVHWGILLGKLLEGSIPFCIEMLRCAFW